MGKFNFSGAVFNANTIIIQDLNFDWKFLNVVINKATTERHYKCINTGAFMCKEFRLGGGLKSITYSLPNSDDYNIKTIEELVLKLKK
jgi:hypothetical protein